MSELRDRLEALAARGTRRGADDVMSAARRDADAAPSADDGSGVVVPLTGDDNLPIVTIEPLTRRRRRGSFIAAAGIAALVGVGVLGVTAMFGSGGAGSPEGAVRQLADAISHKDALAAVDVLVPSEVRSLRETVKGVTKKAADLRIVNEASQPLAGVDLSVDHLELATQHLADGYAKVVVTSGEISANTHRAQMSALLQRALRRGDSDTQAKADLSTLASNSNLPTFVMVVRHGGRWYVSPAYTAFEYVRETNHDPAADFGSANPAELGAASPGAAVEDALRAAQANNWDRVFALAPPDELPLYDYRAMLDRETGDGVSGFKIDQLSTTESVDGDSATVQLTASGTFGDDNEKWQVGGSCPSRFRSYVVDTSASGASSAPSLCLSGSLASLPFSLVAVANQEEASTGPVSISVVREDGRWFVSPVTTVLNVVDETIKNLNQRTAYTLLGIAYELPPDGTITLNEPFHSSAPQEPVGAQVFAFDGKAGEKLVGEFKATGSSRESQSAYGVLYTADGRQIDSVDFESVPVGGSGSDGYITSVKIPSDGSYRLVMESFSLRNAGNTLTLWRLDDAPAGLRSAAIAHDAESGDSNCTYSGGFLGSGVESCMSTATGPLTETPTTFSATGSSSSSSSSSATAEPYPVNGVTETTAPAASTTSSP